MPIYRNGPIRHTVIVTGYDDKNNELIINDPILKKGASIWIAAPRLDAALWDYTTGDNLRLPTPRTTALISIGK